jgi:hypothetical protein
MGPLSNANTSFVGGSSRPQGQEGGPRLLVRLEAVKLPVGKAGTTPDTTGPARGGSSRLQGQEGGPRLLVRLEAVILPVGKAGPLT